MSGPLAGVKVLELGHYIAAPHCTMMLADQGAEVVKVEPPEGEPGRKAPPFSEHGDSLAFACHNRGKRSVTLDLRRSEHRIALDALLRWADLVVTNYAPGVPEKLGFGFERLTSLNPRAAMVHITGYGPASRKSDFGAFDPTIQAMSGFSDLTGAPDGPPQISQFFLADHAAAIHAAYAAMCVLWQRERTGLGAKADISMLEAMTSQLSYHVPSRGAKGESPTRKVVPTGVGLPSTYLTKDAPVIVMLGSPASWTCFSRLLGHPEWAPDPAKAPRLAQDPERLAAVLEEVVGWFAARTARQAFDQLHAGGVISGMFRSVSQLYDEELAEGGGSIAFVELAKGGPPAPTPGVPFRVGAAPAEPPKCPGLGDDTLAVMGALDVSAEVLRSLAAEPASI